MGLGLSECQVTKGMHFPTVFFVYKWPYNKGSSVLQ